MKETTKSDIKILGLILLVALLAIANGAQFLHYHELQSPFLVSVKVQLPWKDKLLSPMATQSAMIPQAAAAEVKLIDPKEVNVFNQSEVRAYIEQETIKAFGYEEWEAMDSLLKGESNYQTYVMNHEGSGACGIFQALPCSKLGTQGLDLENQVAWGLNYVKSRYGTPSKALAFWKAQSPNWY